jgi:putative membrane protein
MIKTTTFATFCVFIAASWAIGAEMKATDFATKAAQSDMFEIEAAHLVAEKGVSDEVKAFAGGMIKDHHKSTEGLKEAAAKDKVALPADMGGELRKKLEALKSLSGPAFDAAYVSTQVSVHTDAVELFDKFSKDGEGGALKSFAQKIYPTIRMHLVRVRNFNVEQ